ncbi:hypothetical protein Sste5346_001476 [Sporothrix stenoceras]|uniref:Ig-like domain-containing protein n=1 Tax=Sporothrix stenoceras TaxID=5173 RepID=A0ABR3ZPZ8_9PEZI
MFSRSVLLLASPAAVLLVSAQVGPPQSPVIVGCTTSSFSIPSWYVQNLTSSSAGVASFHVVNRANNDSADVTCPSGAGWKECQLGGTGNKPALVPRIQVNGTTAHIALNQTWMCNDRNLSQPLAFTAVGEASARLSCAGNLTACTAVDESVLVRGSLLRPVALTPAYSKGPTGHAKEGCAANSKNPRWTLTDISYVDRTGDGVTAMARQDFIAQIINAATGYESGCSANYGLGGGPPIPGTLPNATSPTALHIGCTGAEFGSSAYGQYRPTTDASFDPATSTFTVNQTWFCDDGDAARPVQITAVGSAKLSLNCVTTTLRGSGNGTAQTNKQCVPGAINGTSKGISVTGHVTNTVALPAYSIEEPLPTPDGCTVSSLLHPVWLFSAFGYEQKNGSSTVGNVNFDLILQTSNPGFQFPISISQGPKWSGNTTLPYPVGNATTTTTEPWYDCIIGNGGDDSPTLWPYACRFQYVPSTKQLTLLADWYCSDLDAKHPVAFSGRSTTVASKALNCAPKTVNGVVNTEGVQTCVAADTNDAWTVPITSVVWKSSA